MRYSNHKAFFLILVIIIPINTFSEIPGIRSAAHFTLSGLISFGLCELSTSIPGSYHLHNVYLFSATSTLTIGIVKEFYDIGHNRHFSWEDIGVDVVGIAAGIVCYHIFRERKKGVTVHTRLNNHQYGVTFRYLF